MTDLFTYNVSVATSLGVFRLTGRTHGDYLKLVLSLWEAKPIEFERDGVAYCIPACQVVYLSGQQVRTAGRTGSHD